MMLQIEFSNLTAAAATMAILAALQPAKGAVRVCKEPVSSVIVFEESEKDSKRRALNDWKMKAGLFGEGYTGWRLAANKYLACTGIEGQGYACLARASPCTIKQVPPLKGYGPKPVPG
jgi:hypothetical protein